MRCTTAATHLLERADSDLQRATAMGVSLFAGEAEGRLDRVLQDADAGALALLYNFMDDLPGIEGTPIGSTGGLAWATLGLGGFLGP
jgi:hypothetical protein